MPSYIPLLSLPFSGKSNSNTSCSSFLNFNSALTELGRDKPLSFNFSNALASRQIAHHALQTKPSRFPPRALPLNEPNSVPGFNKGKVGKASSIFFRKSKKTSSCTECARR